MIAPEGKLAGVLGWLLVAIPLAFVLALLAVLAVLRLGMPGGPVYFSALVIWGALLVWRAVRQ